MSDCTCAMSESSMMNCLIHGVNAPDPDGPTAWVDHDLPPTPRRYANVPVTIQKLNTCVCGCPKSAHQLVRLSVPLLPRPDGPLYKVNGTVSDGLGFSPWIDQCTCGCTRYEEDD